MLLLVILLVTANRSIELGGYMPLGKAAKDHVLFNILPMIDQHKVWVKTCLGF